MNTSIFTYQDFGDDDFIDNVLLSVKDKEFHDGKVGNHVDTRQKKRKDYFIKDPHTLRMVDNYIFDKMHTKFQKHFGDIKYREHWKIGKYYGNCEGFYAAHRDTIGDTKYRKMSMICSLTDPSEYEGGELCFDELDITIKLKKGELVIFDSSLLHRVTPITSGIRTVLIGFMFDDIGKEIKRTIAQVPNFQSYISHYIPLLDNIKLEYNIDDDGDEKLTSNVLSDSSMNAIKKDIFGDIDYSDKHKDHPWKVTDDYYMEDNDSDTLLITFAGMGWKQSIPTFIFYNFLKSYTNIDKLFLRDINCRYYISGIKNSTTCFKETLDMYRELIGRKKYKRIVSLGCSAGGYAAILYGQLLGLDKVIAFSPQTVLTKCKEDLIGDTYNAPNTAKWLRSLHLDDAEYQKALDLNNYRPFKCPIDIHYSVDGNKGADKKHAIYLESLNCNVIEHPGNDHMIALTLRDKGKLTEIIDNAIGIDEDIVDISL
jgi:predicted 2-oxoglutarate/Fe(II)-dependent dioxygenase YbiX/predicted esterase YcpF (UPF0227 family)